MMMLPFFVGHSVPAPLLEHLLHRDGNSTSSHLQFTAGASHSHENLIVKLLQPGSSLQNLCLVPLLIVMNLLFALLMQFIARQTRIQAAGQLSDKKPEDRYSTVAAFLRDFAGIQSVYNIAKGWLTHDTYRWGSLNPRL